MNVSVPAMPVMPAPPLSGIIFLVGTSLIVVVLLLWWAFSAERKRGPVMPLVFLGTAFSAIIIEPVFDNTLLYWYPVENPLSVISAYGRTIPWFVPIGYAWFFGGTAYLLQRRFERGVNIAQAMTYFFTLVFIDWFAVSVCEWFDLSAFYGNQPFHFFGSPLWFSFADATGGFVLGAALYGLLPHLSGARKLLLLFLPTFIYGGVLGSTTAPVALALNSGWSVTITWLCGAATIGLCCLLVFVISNILSKVSRLL
ncbi:MAG: hypothetical protein FP814_04090 [Desulfobacterium sp.]|nr:hypothetical protein [Desulfobacterium sp.]MBU4011494.1 hypothetical protein [Pseudomonadota bacterium]MBU4035186.1 hypothetical protein [Pseudomonadota bacterium]